MMVMPPAQPLYRQGQASIIIITDPMLTRALKIYTDSPGESVSTNNRQGCFKSACWNTYCNVQLIITAIGKHAIH